MKTMLKAGLASTVLALSVSAGTGANAADLGGSIKDNYIPAAPMSAGVGPCYFRGDVGYSISQDPSVGWPVTNGDFAGDTNANGVIDSDEITYTRVTDTVSNVSLENTWLAETGLGCGSGSRGFRGEVMFGYRGDRKLDGEPGVYHPGPTPGDPVPGYTPEPDYEDPLHTSVQTYTAMLNIYKDLGSFGRFVPYLGAGLGVAYHDVDFVYFTGNPNLTNEIEGDETLSFAWSLMAGVGVQISDRAILDIGYRYIDMGEAQSGRVDTAGFTNPRVEIDDLEAHEIKVGLRYHFGEDNCCAMAPMK